LQTTLQNLKEKIMSAYAEKAQEHKNQVISNDGSQMQDSVESVFQFVDNRPEVAAQQKLKEMANNSTQAKQAAQLQTMMNNHYLQPQTTQKKENNTGLPDNLKSGIENLSGMSMDDVKVHKNSDQPAQLNAHAYAQGTDIHLGPGQEKHLPHEAWYVVQQKQGRVKPNMQMKGTVQVNDDAGLEKEADVMGGKALQSADKQTNNSLQLQTITRTNKAIQRAEWRTFDQDYKWDELIDGVQWFSDIDGQMWFEVVRPRDVIKGQLADYMQLEGQKKSWSQWNAISVKPHGVYEITDRSPLSENDEKSQSNTPITTKDKIMQIANKNRTSGMWFAWGPKKYMNQWTQVGNVLSHACSVNHSAQGSGLYLASNSWRSATYAIEGGYLLIAKLSGVPTIDIRDQKQVAELKEIGLTDQDLYSTENLTEMLFLYTKNGNYARLTATEGVELITDLNQISLSALRSDYNKYGTDAKSVLKAQAIDFRLNIDDW
jgi:hypothetical protein